MKCTQSMWTPLGWREQCVTGWLWCARARCAGLRCASGSPHTLSLPPWWGQKWILRDWANAQSQPGTIKGALGFKMFNQVEAEHCWMWFRTEQMTIYCSTSYWRERSSWIVQCCREAGCAHLAPSPWQADTARHLDQRGRQDICQLGGGRFWK